MSTTLSIRPKPAHCSQRLSSPLLPMADLEKDPLSARQLSSRQVSEQISQLSRTALSPEALAQALSSHVSSTETLAQQLAKPVTEAALATQYGQTCLSLWQLAQCQSRLGSPSFPQHLSTVSYTQQQFTQQLAQLCRLWAIGKWQQPAHPFFAEHPTAFSALQAKWKNPALQVALREATTHLLQTPQEQWIVAHTDCWAYLLGQVMYQLLQWNYQLTPSLLRGIITNR